MIDVFVSRPNWVPPEFEGGVSGLLNFLRTLDLNPRTIGATDYPTKAPLDAVIELLEQCSGAIILGLPQIIVQAGSLKGTRIQSELPLPTEWNHIEASLAYARGLPLLLVHHLNVGRGVFDRGAISRFLYEVDLAQPTWSLLPAVSGALHQWKAELQAPKPRAVREAPPEPERRAIGDEELRVLQLFIGASRQKLSASQVASSLGIHPGRAQHLLSELSLRTREGRLLVEHLAVGQPRQYALSDPGRAFLVQKGLL